MESWQRQLIRNLFHYSASRMNIERAFMAKHPHVPSRLYKYRKFSPEHLEALSKNVIWLSSPDRFNDPYDSAVFFNSDRFLVEDQSLQDFEVRFDELERSIKAGGEWQPKKLHRPVQQGEWRRKVITNLIDAQDIPNKDKFFDLFEALIKKQAEDGVRRFSEGLQQGSSVLSLSQNYLSKVMWSHYSDSHQGFVIEYDFAKLDYGDLRRRLCFPVFYTRKLRDATRYLARTDMSDFNNLFGQYMCLIKQAEWAYEREWRIILTIGPSEANRELKMPHPSAIILGLKVKQTEEEIMRTFCRARRIPLKRIVQRLGSFDFEVENVIT